MLLLTNVICITTILDIGNQGQDKRDYKKTQQETGNRFGYI